MSRKRNDEVVRFLIIVCIVLASVLVVSILYVIRKNMWMQGLTTKEPTADMAEVAIEAVNAVFDWKAYLKENFGWTDPEAGQAMPDQTPQKTASGENGQTV